MRADRGSGGHVGPLLPALLALAAACGPSDEGAPARGGGAASPVGEAVTAPIDVSGCDGVLVIALDAAPADLLSILGGARATTPRLAELARDAFVVTDHVLASTGLNAALATLATGRHPREHGVGSVATLGRARLRAEERTLAEAFGERAWRTLLATAAPQTHPELSGFHQGFASIHVPTTTEPTRRADQVVGACLPTLRRWIDAEEPFFALIQLSDLDARGDRAAPGAIGARWLEAHLAPHAATSPKIAAALAKVQRDPDGAQADLAELLQRARGSEATRAWRAALRDGRASALDAELGRIVDALAAAGRLDRTLILVQGLRGGVLEPPDESVGPRFLPEVLRTPLFLRCPAVTAGGGRAPRPTGARDALVSAVDAPRLLDGLFRLDLTPTAYPGADLAAVADGRAPRGAEAVLLASADLALTGLVTPTAQLERASGAGDVVFHRSGRTFAPSEPVAELAPAALEALERYAAPATLAVRAPAAEGAGEGAAVDVAWRIERGLVASVALTGDGSEDQTPRRESARRRAGRARLVPGGALTVGLTDRTADVRLDLSAAATGGPELREEGARDGGERDTGAGAAAAGVLPHGDGHLGDWHLGAPLGRVLVPRVPAPRAPEWPADDSVGAEGPLVDVQRAGGASWRLAVQVAGRCEALLTVWPPRAPHEALEVTAGGSVTADAVPGRLDVVRIVGEAPFDVRVMKRPDEQLAFAVRVGDEVLDARRVRVETRRMASDTELSLVVPGWLPGVTEGLFAPGAVAREDELWRVRRTDPAGTFGPEQALAPDLVQLVRSLPGGE